MKTTLKYFQFLLCLNRNIQKTQFKIEKCCNVNTHRKRRIPVFARAKASPKIPLPIMALLRLKTDMPNEVVPGI